jgi:hypothetical protein
MSNNEALEELEELLQEWALNHRELVKHVELFSMHVVDDVREFLGLE